MQEEESKLHNITTAIDSHSSHVQIGWLNQETFQHFLCQQSLTYTVRNVGKDPRFEMWMKVSAETCVIFVFSTSVKLGNCRYKLGVFLHTFELEKLEKLLQTKSGKFVNLVRFKH